MAKITAIFELNDKISRRLRKINKMLQTTDAYLSKLEKRFKKLDKIKASPKVELDDKKFLAQIKRVELALQKLDKFEADATININKKEKLTELKKIRKQFQKFEKEEIDIEFKVDQKGVLKEVKSLIKDTKKVLKDEIDVKVGIDDSEFQKTLKEIYLELRRLEKMSVEVTVGVNDRYSRNFREVENYIRRLNGSNVEIDVFVNNHADRDLNNLQSKLDVLNGRTTRTNVDADTSPAREAISNFIQKITMTRVLLTISPVLVPAAASALGAIGGLTSSLGAAGAGFAAFGSIAVTELSKIFEANEEIKKLQEKIDEETDPKKKAKLMKELATYQKQFNKEQMRGIEAVQRFSKFWNDFSAQFRKPMIDIFVSSLGTLEKLIRKLNGEGGKFGSVFEKSLNAVKNMLNGINKFLDTKEAQDFFDFLGRRAGPAMEAWGKIFGNTFRGVMNLMVAFEGLGVDIENGLVNLTEKFAEWTASLKDGGKNSEKFKKFIEYVKRNGPVLMNTLGNIGEILINVAVALAPVGEKILKMFEKITGVIADFTKEHPKLTAWILAFATLGTVIGAAVVALMKLVALWKTFRLDKTISFGVNGGKDKGGGGKKWWPFGKGKGGNNDPVSRSGFPKSMDVHVTNRILRVTPIGGSGGVDINPDTGTPERTTESRTERRRRKRGRLGGFIDKIKDRRDAKKVGNELAPNPPGKFKTFMKDIVEKLNPKNWFKRKGESGEAPKQKTSWFGKNKNNMNFVENAPKGSFLGKLGKIGGALGVGLSVWSLAPTVAQAFDGGSVDKKALGGQIGSALGGLAGGAAAGAALGSVIPGVGTAIGGIVGGILGSIGGEKLGTMIAEKINFSALKEKLAGLGKDISTKWEEIKTATSNKWNEITTGISNKWEELKMSASNKWTEIKTGISNKWEELKTSASNKWTEIKTGISNKWEELKTSASNKWTEIKTGISNKWEELKTSASEKWTSITKTISNKVEELRTTVSEKWESIKTSIANKWEELKTAASEKWESIKTSIANKWEELKTAASEKWSTIKTTVTNKWEELKTAASEKWSTIKTTVANKWEEMKSAAAEKTEALRTGVSNKWNEIKTSAQNIWENIKSTVSSKIESLRSDAATKTENIRGTVSNKWKEIQSNAGTSWETIKSNVSGKIQSLSGTASGILETMRSTAASKFSSLSSNATTKAKEMYSGVSGQFGGLVTAASSKGQSMLSTLVEKMSSMSSQSVAKVSSMVSSMISSLAGAVSSFSSIGTNMISGLIGGIQSMAGRAVEAAKSVVQRAVSVAKNFLGIHSPSRVFMEIGAFTSQGFALGIQDKAAMAIAQVEKMAQGVVNAATLSTESPTTLQGTTVLRPANYTAQPATPQVTVQQSSQRPVPNITLQITGDNHFYNGDDVEQFGYKLVEILRNALVTGGEGVYE